MTSVNLQNLARRSVFLRAVRDFFYRHGFIEVETPVKIPAPAPEEYIESVRAEGDFLRTSPELAMKELVCAGAGKIFQIGSAFRAGEHGRRHREEFTILEYYAVGWNYRELAVFTAKMIASALAAAGRVPLIYRGEVLDPDWVEYITVDEAYRRYAGVSAFDADADGTFDELMVTRIEPRLGRHGLEFLIDYPASRASLARLSAADPRVAERWELYAAGMELGNAFGELTDPAEQRRRFEAALKLRAEQGMHPYPEPTSFLEALERGMPAVSGCALGVDRLVMLLCDAADIGEVRV